MRFSVAIETEKRIAIPACTAERRNLSRAMPAAVGGAPQAVVRFDVAVKTENRTRAEDGQGGGGAIGSGDMPAALQPIWSLHAPTPEEVAAFLASPEDGGAAEGLSYGEAGASRDDTARPAGYNVDHNRERLGSGEGDFAVACAALRAWRMFPAPWTRIAPAHAPLQVGQIVAMQARALGLWWLNACRIVYLIDEHHLDEGAPVVRRFGFAYGTLRAHVEQGEERFSVELRADGGVWYDLRAFSRPRYWPVRLAKPLARGLQARFVRESKAAMRAAVHAGSGAVSTLSSR